MTTPSTVPASSGTHGDPEGVRAAHGWRVAGLAVLGVWALLLVAAVALWVRVAVLAGPDDGADGTGAADGSIRLLGAPFVLLALGILWWVWRSARHCVTTGSRAGHCRSCSAAWRWCSRSSS